MKGFSRHDVYTMIAAMHAENQLYLSRSVLAYAIGCEPEELERQVLDVLRREAMLDPGETCVLTRHRRIAEAACLVLREDGEDIDRWYPFLARAALRDFRTNFTRDPNIAQWQHGLSEHFVQKGERWWPVARAVGKALYDSDPSDGHRLTSYTSILRRTERAAEAMAVLKATGEQFRRRRDVFYEWSVCAGVVGDHGLNAWLAGRSLADGELLDPLRCKLSLSGLGVAFRELFPAAADPIFTAGEAACGQLGLRLPDVDETTRGYFEQYVTEGRRNGVPDFSPEQAVKAIRRAVILGAQEVEPENDPVFFENLLSDPEGYRYTALVRIVSEGRPTPA